MGDNLACLPPIGSKIPPFCHKFSLLLSWLLPRNRDTENQVAVLKLLVCVGKFEGQKEQERDFRRATEVQYSNTALDIWITKWGDTLSPFYRFDNFDVNYFTPLQNSDLQIFIWPHKPPIPVNTIMDMTCRLGRYPIPNLWIKLLPLSRGVTLLSSYRVEVCFFF